MTLQAYIDDSSSDEGEHRLFLAGYVNTADRWMDFSKAWEEALKEYPAIEYFKMSEAQSMRGQFYGWAENNRDAKVQRLAGIVKAHAGWTIQSSVSKKECTRLLDPTVPYGLARPYYHCFYGLIIQIAKFLQAMDVQIPVDFIFDEQGEVGREAAEFYDYVKNQQIPELKALLGCRPVFKDEKVVMPLQAADMLAWIIRREHQYPYETRSLTLSSILADDAYHVGVDLDTPYLERISQQMSHVKHTHLMRDKKTWNKLKKEIRRNKK